jgi:hypothetical protein
LLEKETSKWASDSPSEGEKRVKSLRGLSNREAQDRQHLHVCRDPIGITEGVKTFQVFREEKFKRKSDFLHKRDNWKECGCQRIIQRFKENKVQEGEFFHAQSLASIAEVERRPFGGFEFKEAQEEKCLQEHRQKL